MPNEVTLNNHLSENKSKKSLDSYMKGRNRSIKYYKDKQCNTIIPKNEFSNGTRNHTLKKSWLVNSPIKSISWEESQDILKQCKVIKSNRNFYMSNSFKR